MAYNEKLANRIREILVDQPEVKEKQMMGGVTFRVNYKMCIGIVKDEMMARIDDELCESALEKHGCRRMDFTGEFMKGWVFISPEGLEQDHELEYWIRLALDFNQKAKPSKKNNSKK